MTPRLHHTGIIFLTLILLLACDNKSNSNTDSQRLNGTRPEPPSQQSPIQQSPIIEKPLQIRWKGQLRIPDQIRLQDPTSITTYVNGKPVKLSNIPVEKFLKNHGEITLRKGKDFFADWSIQFTINNLSPNTTFRLNNTHAMAKIGVKKSHGNLPEVSYIYGIKGVVSTGEMSSLGMPLKMHIEIGPAGNALYQIDGSGFATIGDIRISQGKLDRSYDSFRTIQLIARGYLEHQLHQQNSSDLSAKYIMIRGEQENQEEALQVFSLPQKSSTKEKIVRVQLKKESGKWQPVKILSPWKLLYDYKTGSHKYADELIVLTANKMEQFLKAENIENHLNTDINCNLSKDQLKGLCKATLVVLSQGQKRCSIKAYLLAKESSWKIIKEVSSDLKLDYKTGKLVAGKNNKSSKEEFIEGPAGIVLGPCNFY